MPIGEIIGQLTGAEGGTPDWIEASSLVARLRRFGALDDGSGAPRERRELRLSGRDVEMHIELLNDSRRTLDFIHAIERAVRPGDVVVDLGTGTAVLAMAAARAGARRVYAIEASAFADVAERIIEANGYADRVTVVRGWSSEISLPERADLLVSEIIGNDPLGEGALRYMPDAVMRLLKPSARILPARLAVMAAMVDVPSVERAKHRFSAQAIEGWRESYGFDFTELARVTEGVGRPFYLSAREMAGWRWLGEPVRLFDVSLADAQPGDRTSRAVLKLADAATHPGVVLYAVLAFGDGSVHDTDPRRSRDGHWRVPVRLVPADPHPSAGDGIEVTATWSSLRSQVGVAMRVLR